MNTLGTERGRARSALPRIADMASGALNAAGSLMIFVLMCLICLDVGGRYLFNAPLPGVTEIVEMAIVAIVFAQLADTVAKGRMTRADTLIGPLRTRRPRVARGIDFVAALIGLSLMAVLLYGIVPEVIENYSQRYYVGTPGLFTFPSWPTTAIIAVGIALTAVQLLILAVRAIRGMGDDAAP